MFCFQDEIWFSDENENYTEITQDDWHINDEIYRDLLSLKAKEEVYKIILILIPSKHHNLCNTTVVYLFSFLITTGGDSVYM